MKIHLTTGAFGVLLFCSVCSADVAVIVNPENTAVLSDSDISRLFLGKAVAINLKLGSNTRDEFETKALGKTSSQIKAYWSKQVFSGKGKPPPELVSDKDILSMVAADNNIIAYVDAASVDDTVKVVKIF